MHTHTRYQLSLALKNARRHGQTKLTFSNKQKWYRILMVPTFFLSSTHSTDSVTHFHAGISFSRLEYGLSTVRAYLLTSFSCPKFNAVDHLSSSLCVCACVCLCELAFGRNSQIGCISICISSSSRSFQFDTERKEMCGKWGSWRGTAMQGEETIVAHCIL